MGFYLRKRLTPGITRALWRLKITGSLIGRRVHAVVRRLTDAPPSRGFENPFGDASALVTSEPLPIQVHEERLVRRMAEARYCSTGLQLVGDGDALVEHLNGAIVLPARYHLAGPDRATGVDTEDASFILGDERHGRIGADGSIAGIRDCPKCLPSQSHRFPRLRWSDAKGRPPNYYCAE